ncbi:MAG TPA: ionic transporter y4hA [Burkholderiales bacterium]|jgi:Ca2+:H+ antiporter|nr:ionic transporter y4hA [Burkholderiales bacterium]
MITREWRLAPVYGTALVFFAFDPALLGDIRSAWWAVFMLAWLFGIMLLAAFSVVRHADALAEIFGEPFGTLILTLAITVIEVLLISAVMLTGPEVSTLARDTMFAVVMIVFNGMAGLALLVGGLRYHEQTYNLQGANAFLAVIVPLAVLGLVLPNFTSAPGGTFSGLHEGFLMLMSVALYAVFLAIQTLRHRHYFVDRGEIEEKGPPLTDLRPAAWHGALLLLYIVPFVLLSKKIAVPIGYGVQVLHAPAALVGFLVAALVLAPESLAAVRAAAANQLQRSINLLLGSVLASISLTIPTVLAIGMLTGRTLVLGLESVDAIVLLLTLFISTLTYASGRTNILLGAVHLLLFFAYLVLIFDR